MKSSCIPSLISADLAFLQPSIVFRIHRQRAQERRIPQIRLAKADRKELRFFEVRGQGCQG